MVEPFEAMGIRVLLNETFTVTRGASSIDVTGLDDVHYYYTEQALEALRRTQNGFKIALVHSNEIAEEVAAAGYSLYLSGHTHGGQLYLPGFGAPIVPSRYGQKYLKGLVQAPATQVYVSRGLGTVAAPMRFRSPPELTLLTLRWA
jgi:predicted MPP superfamily phosphohydrolase